jgi:hypothetical protein
MGQCGRTLELPGKFIECFTNSVQRCGLSYHKSVPRMVGVMTVATSHILPTVVSPSSPSGLCQPARTACHYTNNPVHRMTKGVEHRKVRWLGEGELGRNVEGGGLCMELSMSYIRRDSQCLHKRLFFYNAKAVCLIFWDMLLWIHCVNSSFIFNCSLFTLLLC